MERRNKQATKALLMLLVVVAAGATPYFGGYVPEDVEIEFNLDERPLSELLDLLRQILIDNLPRLTINGGIFLAPKVGRLGSPPGRWIKLTLVSGGARTTVAIDDGNLYLVAFKNSIGQWYCFPDFVGFFPGCHELEFEENYEDLAGGHKELVHVPLGHAATIRALMILAAYNQLSTPLEHVKVALATMTVTICEALRFKSVRRTITENWEGQTSLSPAQTEILMVWGNISYCLYLWDKVGRWMGRKYCGGAKKNNILSADDATAAVDLFMRAHEISIDDHVY